MLLAGCGQEEPEYHYQVVEITGIPAEYNGQDGSVNIGGIFERYGTGTVSKGKLIVDICERGDNSCVAWRGSGNFPVIVLLGFNLIVPSTFIYTSGKTFQELQIDENICDESDFLNKLPKIEFRKPEDGGGKTKIEFNKLQMLDCEWWSLE